METIREKMKTGTNFEIMQSNNRTEILRLLNRCDKCSRTELAEKTGLTQASISKIINDMIRQGIVLEGEWAAGKQGRRMINISLNRQVCKVLAVRLTRREFGLAQYWFGGQKISSSSIAFDEISSDPRACIALVKGKIAEAVAKDSMIKAICVVVRGLYNTENGKLTEIHNPVGWDNISIRAELEEAFTVPVIVERDTNAVAFAEWCVSDTHRGDKDETLLTVNTGEDISCGVIRDGRVSSSIRGLSGNLGHVSIKYDGNTCFCGSRGCLREYCSRSALENAAVNGLAEHPDSMLNAVEKVTAEKIFELMKNGDEFCKELVKDQGFYLGLGLVNAVNLVNPDQIIICGIMANGGEILTGAVLETIKARTMEAVTSGLKVSVSTLMPDYMVSGAASVAMQYIIEHPSVLYRTDD